MCQTKKSKKEKLVMDSASNSEAALLDQPPLQSQESRNLLKYIDETFKPIFDQLQIEGQNGIPLKNFRKALTKNKELFKILDDKPPEEILERLKKADLNQDNIISYSEFRRMLYDDRKVMPKKEVTAMVRIFKYAVLVSTASDNQENYFRILDKTPSEYICSFPPPFFLLSMIMLNIGFFIYYYVESGSNIKNFKKLLHQSIFIFNPRERIEMWRYVTYMFLHGDFFHLIFNTIFLIIGIVLELLDNPFWVLLIYINGVISGAIGVSLVQPTAYLVGCSGGIFALIGGYAALFTLSKKRKYYFLLSFVGLVFATELIQIVIHLCNKSPGSTQETSYFSHASGFIAGYLLGLKIYAPPNCSKRVTYIGNVSIIIYCLYYGLFFLHSIINFSE